MTFEPEKYDAATSDTWLVCKACGTQFPSADRNRIRTCRICDDPRQFVPASGQAFTTIGELKAKGHRNVFEEYAGDSRISYITSRPGVGIGQRATLIRTRAGNILWDCITLLDEETVQHIQSLGGLRAIVISHPHFYSAHVQWARAFGCPVYLATDDFEWTMMNSSHQVLATELETDILDTGAKAIRVENVVLKIIDADGCLRGELKQAGLWGTERVDRILRRAIKRPVQLRRGRPFTEEHLNAIGENGVKIVSCMIQASGDVMGEQPLHVLPK
ncbi:hypothetical protein NQ176_g3939 [Zarea fungicola]|uniref:Uncharacterized protein n=1 Tax=Zarea fungicola TaxID=93591 RepID=A0ACC1NHC6_9HYPO|nr:hypothetical protein NQ176_g3939 [Lecanicillium fungicola]